MIRLNLMGVLRVGPASPYQDLPVAILITLGLKFPRNDNVKNQSGGARSDSEAVTVHGHDSTGRPARSQGYSPLWSSLGLKLK